MQEKGPKPKKMRFLKKTTNFSNQFLTINKNRVKIASVVQNQILRKEKVNADKSFSESCRKGARQQRIWIENHLGEGKPNESAVYRTMCRNSSRFSREFPVTETAYACALYSCLFQRRDKGGCGKRTVPSLVEGRIFLFVSCKFTPVIQPGKE